MRTKFRTGDRVRVKRGVSPYPGKIGTVVDTIPAGKYGIAYDVMLDLMSGASMPHPKQYMADELEAPPR